MDAHPDDDEVPPVVSVVLYHGTAQWTAPRTLLGSYNLTKGQRRRMKSSLYRGGYQLDDLQAEDVHALAGRPQTFQLRLGYVMLKLDVQLRPGRRYRQALGLLAQMLARLLRPAMAEQDGGRDLELVVFSYLGSSGSIKEEDVTRLFEQLGPDDQEAVMSLLQTTANKAAARQLLRMLQERFGDLPEGTVRTVNGGSQGDLDRWFLQFVHAARLDEVFR